LLHTHNNKHPFVKHLQTLHGLKDAANKRYPFVLAPSPSLAAWALNEEKRNLKGNSSEKTTDKSHKAVLKIYNLMEIQKHFQKAPTESLEVLISDHLQKDKCLKKQ